jgi:drug/metabolite transporter (DMT)-like permease
VPPHRSSGQAPTSGGQPGSGVSGRALLTVNLAVALFGLAGVLSQLTGLPSPVVVLGRAGFGAAALLGIAWMARIPLRVGRATAVRLVGQGVLLAVHWTLFFHSIAVAGVAIGLLSFATFPLFTAALEPTLLGARLSRPQLVAACCMAIAVYVLVPDSSLESSAVQGIGWGLLAAATFALLAVLNRSLGQSIPSLVLSLYQNGVAAIALLPVLWLVPAETLREPRTLILLVILGVVCTAIAHTLFLAGLQQMTAQLASVLVGVEPVWGILLALLLLGEWPAPRSMIGGAIIVAATLLPAVLAFRERRAAASTLRL